MGSGKFRRVAGQVLNDRFRAGSEPRSEPRVPGRFRGTSSGKFPGQPTGLGFGGQGSAGRFQNGSGQVSRL